MPIPKTNNSPGAFTVSKITSLCLAIFTEVVLQPTAMKHRKMIAKLSLACLNVTSGAYYVFVIFVPELFIQPRTLFFNYTPHALLIQQECGPGEGWCSLCFGSIGGVHETELPILFHFVCEGVILWNRLVIRFIMTGDIFVELVIHSGCLTVYTSRVSGT